MPIRKRQSGKAIDTQQNDQKGLDTVYNQGKDSGIHFINPIKHHHGNDGEVPRPRPVGSRYNYGECTDYKHDQCRHHVQVGGESEAIECKIEMEKVACPNG